MRGAGFQNLEAGIIHDRTHYRHADDFVEDRAALFYPISYAEMTDEDWRTFMAECRAAMKPLVSANGVTIEVEVMFYSGMK